MVEQIRGKIPAEVFGELLKKCREKDGLALFLFDSGRRCFFAAVCRQMEWKPTGEQFASLDKDATPAYYRDASYRAWFKLTKIDEHARDPAGLTSWTYVRVDDLLE